MTRLLQSLRRVLRLTKPVVSATGFSRSIDTDFSILREGDRVLLLGKQQPVLSKPLRRGDATDTRQGNLKHDSIIDRRVRDVIKTNKGAPYRATLPNLDEYVAMTPRMVTPIYAGDANLIVSLLNLHVGPPAEREDQPPLEIFESGTGHGSLTLRLAQAIQGANVRPPPMPAKSQVQYLDGRPIKPGTAFEEKLRNRQARTDENVDDPAQQRWNEWRARRSAVIHTVDVSPNFSEHAEKIVRGFRREIYAGNVDFYVGHVGNWVTEQEKQRGGSGLLGRGKVEPFLSCAMLDMPAAHLNIPLITPLLKTDGVLVVFMPSITQIGDCVSLIKTQRLPYIMEEVIELGMGLSSGRQWDVRLTTPKSAANPSSWNDSTESDTQSEGSAGDAPRGTDDVLICRPKVGLRLVGGGFVGVWKRIKFEDRPG